MYTAPQAFMRKIESEMNNAIRNRMDWHKDNTEVCITGNTATVYLHNNHIATVGPDKVTLYDGGWRSNTTKSRLNAILDGIGQMGVGVFQQNWNWFINTPRGGTEPFYSGFEI